MENKFKNIGEVFSKNSAFFGVRKAAKEYDAIVEFRKLFPELSDILKPLRVDKGVMIVKVENSVWRNELHLKKEDLIKRINLNLKENVIRNIKFI